MSVASAGYALLMSPCVAFRAARRLHATQQRRRPVWRDGTMVSLPDMLDSRASRQAHLAARRCRAPGIFGHQPEAASKRRRRARPHLCRLCCVAQTR